MSGFGVNIHGRTLKESVASGVVLDHHAELQPYAGDLWSYPLCALDVELSSEDEELKAFLAKFRHVTAEQLYQIRPSCFFDPPPEESPECWHPPLVQAAALEALAKEFREGTTGAQFLWDSALRIVPYEKLPGYIRRNLEAGTFHLHYPLPPGDWRSAIAVDMEQTAKELRLLAENGETQTCLVVTT